MLALATLACSSADDSALDVALIGTPEEVLTSGLRLSGPAQQVRSATQSGLVTLNANGEVVPDLAEAWTVLDDGRSFIFRLRQGLTWPDGQEMTAASVERALREAIAGLEGTSLAQDLALIEEVRAMAGRVIEIRLSAPVPYLVQLVAQPELAIRQPGGATGPMMLTSPGEEGGDRGARAGSEGVGDTHTLAFRPPEERGLPEDPDWQEEVRPLNIRLVEARDAIAMFDAGEVEVVMGGRLGSYPLIDLGPLSTGTLRVETPIGLFGLQVRAEEGLLSNSGVREGLAMALDRDALLEPLGITGWTTTTRPVAPGLPGEPGLVGERWADADIADLRAEAAGRIAAWRRQFDSGDLSRPAPVTIAMPEGGGWQQLFTGLSQQYRAVGIELRLADDARSADLVLIDRIARYASPLWFLNQFHCSLERGLCAEEVDRLVAEAIVQDDAALRGRALAQAEALLTIENVYIPIANPLRWSLVRGNVDGFALNAYGYHALPDLARRPR